MFVANSGMRLRFPSPEGANPMIFAIVISGFVFGCIWAYALGCLSWGALLFAVISTAAISSANGFGGGKIVLAVLAVMVSLQYGYVVGLGASYIMERTWLPIRAWKPLSNY
jgi:hypothetical protein